MYARSLIFILFLINIFQQSFTQTLSSPDQQIQIELGLQGPLRFEVKYAGQPLILPSPIDLRLKGEDRGIGVFRLKKSRVSSRRDTIVSPVPEKRSKIPDHYNELILEFKEPYSLEFRAYNDGFAYRWLTRFKDSIVVMDEIAGYHFAGNYRTIFSPVAKRAEADSFHTSFEEPYLTRTLDSIGPDQLIFSPLLIQPAALPALVLTESDLESYPGMFLRGTQSASLQAVFAPYPLAERISEGEFPQAIVTQRADYIAHVQGTRNFPWRVFALAPDEKDLAGNDLVYRLGAPSRVQDVSWIRPGIGTDEWIIGINLFNVPFKAGINTETYKYYIDFAKRFGLERIMFDAGWSDYKDLFKINPDLDMEALSAYAKQQGVGLSMWTLAHTLDKQLEPAMAQFQRWGVDFVMTDFMDRDDQPMVDFYYRVAEAAARHKIMVMYHGAFKPAGFSRTYPNAVTREGVLGSEYNIWSEKATPEHNVLLPYIRMVAGPMDYEPGLLNNATKEIFRPVYCNVASIGTRCNQLAMFIVYDSPIQIFSGNPSQGMMEPAFMEFMGTFPTTWDETRILDGKIGDYIVSARQKGNDWFIAGMTDANPRKIALALDFLAPGTYEATLCKDGVNAGRYASDYTLGTFSVQSGEKLDIEMAPAGGFVLRLRKK